MDPAQTTEAALWQRTLVGDGEAFGSLFDQLRDRLFRHACRLVETRQDAEDVVAAAFLELWRRRDDVRMVNGSVLPWLLVTASNLSRNVARGTRRYRSFLDRLPREASVPDTAFVTVDEGWLGIDPPLRAALRALSKSDLELFVLVAMADYSIADAAMAVDISPSAAKTRLHRIRLRIRDALGNDPEYAAFTHAGDAP